MGEKGKKKIEMKNNDIYFMSSSYVKKTNIRKYKCMYFYIIYIII
jgi:hypothetical protein